MIRVPVPFWSWDVALRFAEVRAQSTYRRQQVRRGRHPEWRCPVWLVSEVAA